jgi:hypothetical protein
MKSKFRENVKLKKQNLFNIIVIGIWLVPCNKYVISQKCNIQDHKIEVLLYSFIKQ